MSSVPRILKREILQLLWPALDPPLISLPLPSHPVLCVCVGPCYLVDSVEVSSTGYHGALCRYQSCYPHGPPLSCSFPVIYAGSGIRPDQFRPVQLVQFSSRVRYLSSSVSVLPSWRNTKFAAHSVLPAIHSTGPQLSLQSCSALCLFSHFFQLSSNDLLLNLFFAAPSRLEKALATLSIPAVFLLGL